MAAIALENPLQWKRPLPVEDDDRPDSTQKRPRTDESLTLSISNSSSPHEASDDDIRFQKRPKKYKCDHEGCNRAFDRPCRLEEHIRQHTGERPFVCDEPGCGKTFQRDYHLSRHKRDAHENVRDHACSYTGCGQKFATKQRLRNHEKSHEKKAQYLCKDYPPCNEQFRKKSTLQAHISEKHLGQNPYMCTLTDYFTGQPCSRGFKTSQALNRHVATNHSGPRFMCTACSTVPSSPTMTESSMLAHPTSPVTASTSMNSAIAFPTHQALQQHIKDHHHTLLPPRPPKPQMEAIYACDREGCTSKFNRRSNLRAHVRNVHDKDRRFVCGTTDLSESKGIAGQWDGQGCGQGFVYKQLLEKHVRSQHLGLPHTSTMSPAATSRRAGKGDAAVASLLGDLRLGQSRHTEAESACILCGDEFTAEEELVEHYVSDHHVAEAEIGELLLEGTARSGGAFWIGGINPDYEEREEYEDADEVEDEEHIENWFDEQERLRAQAGKEMHIDPQLFENSENEDDEGGDPMEM